MSIMRVKNSMKNETRGNVPLSYKNRKRSPCKKIPIAKFLKKYTYHPNGFLIFNYLKKPVVGWVGNSGYLYVDLDAECYKIHRVIYAMVKRVQPPEIIDHINGDIFDNRIENLREATMQQNLFNMSAVRSKSGFKGVTPRPNGKMWRSRIRCNGRLHDLGDYDSPEEAAQVYDRHAKRLFGKFASLNFKEKP